MKIKPYVEKLEKSEEFEEFREKYPNAFMIAGFFVLDFDMGNNVHQIDFFIPDEKKVAAFTLDGEKVQLQMMNMPTDKIPAELSLDTNVDLDALKGILVDEMHNRGMSEEIKKIIAVIQNLNGKRIWNLNCVLTGMEILKSHIEDESQMVLKIEKKSLMEIMQHIPAQKLMKAPETKKDVTTEIKNLNRLEQEIEKEKSRLQSELKKKKNVQSS